jgi:NADH dehydrogenase (ubiquinone) 1 alpha/beta subcomplex 1, acyl-carrier protein
MLSHILRTSLKVAKPQRVASLSLVRQSLRTYYPNGQLMKRDEGTYYSDPINVAERVVRLIALHDSVRDPSAVTLESDFSSLGFNVLDL